MQVTKWKLLDTDFTAPGRELGVLVCNNIICCCAFTLHYTGPTLKLRRHAVMKKYEAEIKKMYEET